MAASENGTLTISSYPNSQIGSFQAGLKKHVNVPAFRRVLFYCTKQINKMLGINGESTHKKTVQVQ